MAMNKNTYQSWQFLFLSNKMITTIMIEMIIINNHNEINNSRTESQSKR